MSTNKEQKLPSGAKLKIALAPFAKSKALYQALLEEGKAIKLEAKTDLDYNFFKDALCSALSSQKVEQAIVECMSYCTYGQKELMKIDEDTFEDEDARQDYLIVVYEVAMANVLPFTKGLSAKFGTLFGEVLNKAQKP